MLHSEPVKTCLDLHLHPPPCAPFYSTLLSDSEINLMEDLQADVCEDMEEQVGAGFQAGSLRHDGTELHDVGVLRAPLRSPRQHPRRHH